MRYLLLTADFPPIEGGISTVTTELAAGLHTQGKLAAVGAPQVDAETYNDSSFPYPVFRIPGYQWGAFRAIPARSTVFNWVREHRNDFDKIIALNSGFGGWLGKWLKKKENIPFDTLVYGFEFLKFKTHPLARSLLLSIYRQSNRVLAISDFTARRIEEFGVDKDKIHRIQLRVDTEKFHPRLDGQPLREKYKALDAKILLTVGRLIPRKNHRLVLEALPDILEKYPETQYWIAGRGPEENSLRQVCSFLGLDKNVRFLGYVPNENLPGFFAACDLYMMPTLKIGSSVEGFGLVYLEAGACGKPSIASPSGGATEAVIDQVTGLHVNPYQSDEITEAVIHLFSHPEQIKTLGQNAREHAEKHSFEKMVSVF